MSLPRHQLVEKSNLAIFLVDECQHFFQQGLVSKLITLGAWKWLQYTRSVIFDDIFYRGNVELTASPGRGQRAACDSVGAKHLPSRLPHGQ